MTATNIMIRTPTQIPIMVNKFEWALLFFELLLGTGKWGTLVGGAATGDTAATGAEIEKNRINRIKRALCYL
jgi:hypothetical protein